jgi:trans-2,3-dihydro-3-hydroxyanthranilate isomerase
VVISRATDPERLKSLLCGRVTGLRYDVVDVFTDRPFAGNPLAVVHGAVELSTAAMQAIAAEFGLSETAFVLPPTVAAADYRLRIFTPRTELVFAGHPSVGSAWVLAQAGLIAAGSVVQECAAGLIGVQVDEAGAQVEGGVPVVGPRLDGAALAAAVGLVPGELDPELAAGVAAAGAPFAFLPVFAPAVARAAPDPVRMRAVVPDPLGLTVLAFDGGARRAHVRMFRPGSGAGEDPATGSAENGVPPGRRSAVVSSPLRVGNCWICRRRAPVTPPCGDSLRAVTGAADSSLAWPARTCPAATLIRSAVRPEGRRVRAVAAGPPAVRRFWCGSCC